MATTIQNTIDFVQPFIQYSPMAVGAGNQPAIGIANEIQYLITDAPFVWGWNRDEDSSISTTPGTQDYTIPLTDFSFLEKVSLTDPSGAVFEVMDVYNTSAIGIADTSVNKRARPNSACITSLVFGSSIKLRFMGCPDKVYLITLTFQNLVSPFTTLTGPTGTWSVPDSYQDIYNYLFLGEALATVDDARAIQYRQRGVATLLAKAEGLSEMQKNVFLEHFWLRAGRPEMAGALHAQQGIQTRTGA